MEVKCACGMTNSCADPSGEACHFDDNDGIWREHSGYLTDKPTLPVKKLKFGDTGANSRVNGKGFYTLVKLTITLI